MRNIFAIVCVTLFCYSNLFAQDSNFTKYELTGKVSFDESNVNGFIGNAALTIGDGGTGLYKAAMVADTSLTTHTIYMPFDLSPFGAEKKLPVIVYGNGGCRNGSVEIRNFLSEIASHGFLVIAVGPFKNSLFQTCESDGRMSDPQSLIKAIDWAIEKNGLKTSRFFSKIDVTKIAVMGQSCGGLMAMAASKDPRVTAVVMLNSGLFASPPTSAPNADLKKSETAPSNALPMTPKSYLKSLHSSIAYFVGGKTDMATPNALDDFSFIENIPVLVANYDFSDIKASNPWGYGHYPATYREPNGGDFAQATAAWLKWQLKGDQKAAEIFFGSPCGLEKNPKWSVIKKNID